MIKHAIYVALAACLAAAAISTDAFALDHIIRPYMSPRSAAMGGTRYTTGLFEENFFANPARASSNPNGRFTLLDLGVEWNSNLTDTIGTLLSSSLSIDKLAEFTGKNNHGRLQTQHFGVYFAVGEDRKMSFAFSLMQSTQLDVDIRKSYRVEPSLVFDIGPAITVARKFMEDDVLQVGITTHLAYRISSRADYSILNLLRGQSISPTQGVGEGAMLDFDIGGTYELPLEVWDTNFDVALAMNNLLGGGFSNLGIRPIGLTALPAEQPRSVSLGIVATRDEIWKLTDTTLAFEITDIGNNTNGNLGRLLHIGAETHFSVLAARLGINQGYFTAGIGLDLRFLQLDLTTYGEEMALVTGGMQDRRFAARLALQIQ